MFRPKWEVWAYNIVTYVSIARFRTYKNARKRADELNYTHHLRPNDYDCYRVGRIDKRGNPVMSKER